MELGAQVTMDDCLLDHDDIIISIDERKLIMNLNSYYDDGSGYEVFQFDYQDCFEEMRIDMTAYFCKQ